MFQKTGKGNPEARKSVDEVLKVYVNLRPSTKVLEFVAQQFLTTFSDLIKVRNKRLLQATESMSWVMWAAVIGVGVVVVGMSCGLYMDRRGPHLVMAGIMSALIGVLLFVLLLLDHPFIGPLAITAEPFESDLALFTQIDSDFTVAKQEADMRFSTLPQLAATEREIDVVYASVEGVNEQSFQECLEALELKAHGLGATALVGMQLVQSQFQWNQRTSLLATAIKEGQG